MVTGNFHRQFSPAILTGKYHKYTASDVDGMESRLASRLTCLARDSYLNQK
jgi:hypothetical protein